MSPGFSTAGKSTILFLQGPPSPFWYELADAFEHAGARTLRVNLCSADWLFWRRKGAINYRGSRKRWPDFLRDLIRRENITHIIYFSDRFPYHAVAQQVADEMGVQPLAVEFGYLRPGWLTLERGGMGVWSHFPDDPAAIHAIAGRCGPQPAEGFEAHKTSTELTFEVLFNLVNEYCAIYYPLYRSGRIGFATFEYLSGLRHTLRRRLNEKATAAGLADYYAGAHPFNLVPLQLQTDYQIRENTDYKDQKVFLREIIRSFAQEAPAARHLLIKLHPLDSGQIPWARIAHDLAEEFGVAGRVHCFDGGNLSLLIEKSSGVLVSNSTVGLMSIRALKPTIALGDALYNMPGLTHQGSLDAFWNAPDPVDPGLRDAFVTALAGTIQVRGSVYDKAGRIEACTAIVRRVLDGGVNGYGAFDDPPPRFFRRRRPFS